MTIAGKVIIIGYIFAVTLLGAAESRDFYGSWKNKRSFEGGKHTETETIKFNPGSFSFELTVDITKGNYSVKGLTIEATGIWKLSGDTLVTVVEQIKLKNAGSAKNINEKSLGTLVREFRGRYLSDPIRIYRVINIGSGSFTIKSEQGKNIDYKKQP